MQHLLLFALCVSASLASEHGTSLTLDDIAAPIGSCNIGDAGCERSVPVQAAVFVINLAKRHDRAERMQSLLQQLDFSQIPGSPAVEFFPGIDGSALSPDQLHSLGLAARLSWTDDVSGRPLSTGEIGCASSHYLVWNEIVSRGLDYALILEDDLEISTNFVAQLQPAIAQFILTNHSDFLYLGRKVLSSSVVEESVGSGLVKASRSWWTCGYVLTAHAARRLASMKFARALFVVDEYLPVMFGLHPNSALTSEYLAGETPLRSLAFEKDLISPIKNCGHDSATEYSTTLGYQPGAGVYRNVVNGVEEELVLITIASELNEGCKRFLRSCAVYGLPYRVAGLDEPWLGNDLLHHTGGGQKVNLLRRALQEFETRPNTIIMFSDSYDALLTGSAAQIMSRYLDFGKEIVFSAERACWPRTDLAALYPTADGPYPYLNSGGFIGRAGALLKFIEPDIMDSDDDQGYYTLQFLRHLQRASNVTLDYRAEIFQTLGGSFNDVEVDIQRSKLKNKITGTQPLHFHGNGGLLTKTLFNHYSNYLAQQFRPSYGFNRVEYPTLPAANATNADARPAIFIAVLVYDLPVHFELTLLGISELNYPKELITLYVHFASVESQNLVSTLLAFTRLQGVGQILLAQDVVESEQLMRDLAIEKWRQSKEDFYFAVDSTTWLTDPDVLLDLLAARRDVVAPLMSRSRSQWSSFWSLVTAQGFYASSPDYTPMVTSEYKGIFNVPYIYGSYLLSRSVADRIRGFFSKGFQIEEGSDMAFCKNLRERQMFMHVITWKRYGYLLDDRKDAELTRQKLENLGQRQHPSLYTYFINQEAWEDKYFDPEFIMALRAGKAPPEYAPCQDVYVFRMFTPLFCQHLIEETERSGLWSSGVQGADPRLGGAYENVPTVDIHLKQIGLDAVWEHIVMNRVARVAAAYYGNFKTTGTHISFVVKYSMEGQRHLTPHHDASSYTINVALTRPTIDFEGGGVEFIRYGCQLLPQTLGLAMLHPGRMTHIHRGLPITSGMRYILVSFIN